jgi:energy-converting hydrogenase Eha subunit F
VEVLFWWFTLSLVAAWIASNKNRNGIGVFFLSLALSPVIGLLVAFSMQRNDPSAPTPESHVKCPDCAELVKREARVCKHCGCKLVPQ